MHEKLKDLRLLYLAHEIEEAFEGLERALHKHLGDTLVRQQLAILFEGGPNHKKLEQELKTLNAEVAANEGRLSQRDILQALLDCERMAHDFYIRRLDDLSDPKLVDLFRGLAAEEAKHSRAVEMAMGMVPQ